MFPDPPRIEPSNEVCLDVMMMMWRSSGGGLLVLCDRKSNHTGKHMSRGPKGRIEWWGKALAAAVEFALELPR